MNDHAIEYDKTDTMSAKPERDATPWNGAAAALVASIDDIEQLVERMEHALAPVARLDAPHELPINAVLDEPDHASPVVSFTEHQAGRLRAARHRAERLLGRLDI